MKFYVLAVSLGVVACQQPPENKSPLFGKGALRNAQDAGRAVGPTPEIPGIPPAPVTAAGADAPMPGAAPVAVSPSPAAPSEEASAPNPNPSPSPASVPQTPAPAGAKASIVGKWKGCANLSDLMTGALTPGMPLSQSTEIEFTKDGKHKSEVRFFKSSDCQNIYDALAVKAGVEAALAGLSQPEAAMARKALERSFSAMAQTINDSGTYKAEEGEAGKTLNLDIDDHYLAYAIKGNELHLSTGCTADDMEADREACPKIIGDKPENRDTAVDDSLKLRRAD